MLQRAASNAYSWWWASHIRTRQSKWLDHNLQEMEHRVKCILLLLGEEADSFAKRAEMYYKRRPEVINSVEEAYRAYRALAERYDHMSGELHKANHTIANAFPDQVQYAMVEEDDDNLPKAFTMVDTSKIHKATVEELMKKKKGGQLGLKDRGKNSAAPLNKENAQAEISRLQKEILVLQTEKEFIKSSYESGIAKYWGLEKQINDMQEEVCYFQEEFNESAVIEDDEARALMTATALKSCENTLIKLQEQRKSSSSQAMIESERVRVSRDKLKAIMNGYGKVLSDSANYSEGPTGKNGSVELEDLYHMKQEKSQLQTIIDKIKEHFETDSDLSVAEVAEKIDELVNKVVDLELMVSSQTGQINRMCLENTELEKSLQKLEEEKTALMSGSSDLTDKLKQAEEELIRVQTLKSSFHADEGIVYSNFTKTISTFHDVSEMLQLPIIEHQASSAPMLTDEAMASINTEPSSEHHVTKAAEDPDIDEAAKNAIIDGFTDHPEKLQPANINGNSMTSCGCNEIKAEKQYVVDDSENLWPFELEDMSVAAPLVENETIQCADMDSSGDHNKTEMVNVHDVVSNVGSSTQLDIIRSQERGSSERLHHISCIGPGDLNVKQEISKQDSSASAHVISEGHLEQKTNKEEYSYTRKNSTSSDGKAGEVGSSMQSDIVHSQERGSLEQLHYCCIGPGDPNEKQEEMSKQDTSTSGHVISEGYLEQETNKAEDSKTRGNSPISSTGKGGEFGYQENMIKLQQLLMNGLQDKEKVLLAEYTSILRNYKDAKRRLREAETKNQECLNEMTAMISELRCANAIKDEEIWSLRELLKEASCNGLQKNLSVSFSVKGDPQRGHQRTSSFLSVHQRRQSVSSISRMIIKNSNLENDPNLKYPTEGDASNDAATDPESLNLEDFKLLNTVEMENTSPLEEKFRRNIDALLEENLEFWMKFSTSFQRIQGFKAKHEKLQSEVGKLINDDKPKPNNGSTNDPLAKDESVAMEEQLRALKTELQVWLEKNAMLRGELQCRFTSLCNIQEEITGALEIEANTEEGAHITSYQAAKLQGEVLNMIQENNKVADELQGGLDHIKGLQAETEKALAKLLKTTSLSDPKGSSNVKHVLSKSRVPLRSFLFPAKNKKPSLFACVNPAFQKQHSDMKFFTKMD